ncbi:MAG: hypothetical protein LUI87_02595 [Lachnospiraceae bacterium]|nr:hypothetical protein [Lachnospiraceae bacterium]
MSENIQSIIMMYLSSFKKLYGRHLRKVVLQCTHRDEESADEADVTVFILLDMPDEKIEQYSESLSVICTDLLIEHSIWVNPVVKNKKQIGFAETTMSNEQTVVYEADEKYYI